MITLATPRQINQQIMKAVRESRKQWLSFSLEKQEDLKRLYESAALEIKKQLSFYAEGDGSIGFERLQSLLRDVEITIGSLGKLRNAELEVGINTSARMGIETYTRPLDLAGYGTGELVAVFGLVHRNTVEAMYDFILGDGLQLSDRLFRLDRRAKEKVTEVIEQAVVRGQSARKAARSLLQKGEPLSKEVVQKMGLNTNTKIGSDVFELFTAKGQRNVVHNALRLTRTELARAHREGFLRTGQSLSTVIGHRWQLSASHPRPDICDTLASQDIDNLGPGGYKKDNYPITPAHPECLCLDTPIFSFEVEEN